jgi:murein DD-endopeptidase MepM/ murein hydrolase activator NlpD
MKRFVMLLIVLVVTGTPAAAAGGGVWPLAPRPPVVRGFEPPPEPWLPGHRGVDLLGSPGQRVRAAAAGTVTFAGTLAGRGVVVVSHGTTRTTYEPVLPSVRAGALVAAGAPLGTLSGAAGHCPPRVCLHWGLLRDKTYLDPLSMLGSAPVRLLPLRDHPSDPVSGLRIDQDAGSGSGPSVPHERAAPAGSSGPARAVVGLAALATVAAGLLVRRH